MEDNQKTGNLEIDKKEGTVKVRINPKIYSMSVIYGAAHAFTKDNYVLLDGDEEIEICVELKPMESSRNLEELGRTFCNRLLSYRVYKEKMRENESVRNLILYRALATNSAVESDEEVDDPHNIAAAWEEKNSEQNAGKKQ